MRLNRRANNAVTVAAATTAGGAFVTYVTTPVNDPNVKRKQNILATASLITLLSGAFGLVRRGQNRRQRTTSGVLATVAACMTFFFFPSL